MKPDHHNCRENQRSASQSRKSVILIVDDVHTNIDLLKNALIEDYLIRPANNGPLALKLATTHPCPDLILLDIMMPDMNGYEVCRQLKANPATQHIPVIFITSKSNQEDELIGLKLGAVDYVTKPFNVAILRARVKNHLESKQQRDQLLQQAHNLMEQEERMRSFMENALDAIITIDLQGRVVEFNHAAEQLFGYSQQEILGKEIIHYIIPPEFRERHQAALARWTQQSEEPFKLSRLIELPGLRADGKIIEMQFALTTVTSMGKRYFTAFVKDITDRRQFSKSLNETLTIAESSSRAKSEFLANMSHEIRTPMNAIMGLTELALRTELLPKTRNYLNKISNASRSLLRIINDILDFSKIEAGKLELESVDFVLQNVLDHLMDLFRQPIAGSQLDLSLITSAETRLTLIGDPLRLEQILMNLISNAIKFTQQGSVEVAVRTVATQDNQITLEFSVHDTGIGLTSEQAARLFQPFHQADGSTTRKYGGTGLGLSICKRLVEMFQGQIWVESQPGQGSTFRFTAQFQQRAPTLEEQLTIPEAIQRLRVLVIDDNASSRHALETVLQSWSFDTLAVQSGAAAQIAIRQAIEAQHPFQLLLIDWHMPQPDGIATTREILNLYRQIAPMESFPNLILLSTFEEETPLKQEALAAGVNGFCLKPINTSLLFNLILELFGLKQDRNLRPDSHHPTQLTAYRKHLGGSHVLLVEDNRINQKIATEILENVNMIIEVAQNGQEAITLLNQRSFDIVLMDIQMPIMDGLTAARHIRAHPNFQELPIIAMTAHAMTGDREKSLAAGMNEHITKPIDIHHLYKILLQWLPSRNASNQRAIPPDPPQTQPDSPPLPDRLPGLNIKHCLQRFNGNQASVWRILLASQEDFSKANNEMRTLLQGKRQTDRESAQRLAHTIKGLAATLTADILNQTALALETGIRENRTNDWSRLLDDFEKALQEILNSIQTLENTYKTMHNIPHGNPEPLTPDELEHRKNLLFKLTLLINKNNFKSRKTLELLTPLLPPETTRNEVEQLSKHIARFDFKSAQIPLIGIYNALNIPWEQP